MDKFEKAISKQLIEGSYEACWHTIMAFKLNVDDKDISYYAANTAVASAKWMAQSLDILLSKHERIAEINQYLAEYNIYMAEVQILLENKNLDDNTRERLNRWFENLRDHKDKAIEYLES